ncbi:MAG TPA: hypothetical protein VE781_02190, partial [Kineosporiaceae bacterium]|nr:hypothetical protein [Kineosporiaceae bacterium]
MFAVVVLVIVVVLLVALLLRALASLFAFLDQLAANVWHLVLALVPWVLGAVALVAVWALLVCAYQVWRRGQPPRHLLPGDVDVGRVATVAQPAALGSSEVAEAEHVEAEHRALSADVTLWRRHPLLARADVVGLRVDVFTLAALPGGALSVRLSALDVQTALVDLVRGRLRDVADLAAKLRRPTDDTAGRGILRIAVVRGLHQAATWRGDTFVVASFDGEGPSDVAVRVVAEDGRGGDGGARGSGEAARLVQVAPDVQQAVLAVLPGPTQGAEAWRTTLLARGRELRTVLVPAPLTPAAPAEPSPVDPAPSRELPEPAEVTVTAYVHQGRRIPSGWGPFARPASRLVVTKTPVVALGTGARVRSEQRLHVRAIRVDWSSIRKNEQHWRESVGRWLRRPGATARRAVQKAFARFAPAPAPVPGGSVSRRLRQRVSSHVVGAEGVTSGHGNRVDHVKDVHVRTATVSGAAMLARDARAMDAWLKSVRSPRRSPSLAPEMSRAARGLGPDDVTRSPLPGSRPRLGTLGATAWVRSADVVATDSARVQLSSSVRAQGAVVTSRG